VSVCRSTCYPPFRALLQGAAKMVLEQHVHPEQLKDEVCSTGGTSIYALHRLESCGFRGALMDAVEAGTLRSIEMGQHHINNND